MLPLSAAELGPGEWKKREKERENQLATETRPFQPKVYNIKGNKNELEGLGLYMAYKCHHMSKF